MKLYPFMWEVTLMGIGFILGWYLMVKMGRNPLRI